MPCILQDARSKGGTSDISCRTIPALETARTAMERVSHAPAGAPMDSPMRSVRQLSVQDAGGPLGPLHRVAYLGRLGRFPPSSAPAYDSSLAE